MSSKEERKKIRREAREKRKNDMLDLIIESKQMVIVYLFTFIVIKK